MGNLVRSEEGLGLVHLAVVLCHSFAMFHRVCRMLTWGKLGGRGVWVVFVTLLQLFPNKKLPNKLATEKEELVSMRQPLVTNNIVYSQA